MRRLIALLVLLVIFVVPARVYATDLLVQKELLTQGPLVVGDSVKYRITVRNDKIGDAIDTGVQLFDRHSPGLVLVDVVGDFTSADCAVIAPGLEFGFDCTFPLAAQEVKTATVTFIATEPGQKLNAVSVNPTVGEIDGRDNEAQVSVLVEGTLTIIKRGFNLTVPGASEISPGMYVYTIEIVNSRAEDVFDLEVSDVIPAMLGIHSGSGGLRRGVEEEQTFTPCPTDQSLELTCGPFSLASGESVAIIITLSIAPAELYAEICNTAILKQSGGEVGRATACAPVTKRAVARDEAQVKTTEIVETACMENDALCTEPCQTLSEVPLPAGTQVCDGNGENCTTLEDDYWAATRDYAPNALYSHTSYLDLVPAATDESGPLMVTTLTGTGLPHRIFTPQEDGTTTEVDLSCDADPDLDLFPSIEIDNNTPPAAPRVCALLVNGFAQNAKERTGFQGTRSVMQQYLTTARRGPRLPPGNVEVVDNPTAAELQQKLTALKGMCDTFYFYYYGHGNANGLFLKSNNDAGKFVTLGYAGLAAEIYGVEASENTVVLDNCNAGAAVPKFKGEARFKQTNLTLLTGASADNLAYQVFKTNLPDVLVSFYTGGLAICANDARADTDGQNGVSLKEAHHWLRRVNPRLLRFSNQQGGVDRFGINQKQNPQLLENRVQQQDGTKTSFNFPEAGVMVTLGSGQQARKAAIAAVRVEEMAPRGGPVPEDDDLIALAERRHRTVEVIESSDQGFVIDITFNMDAALDSLATTGLPGLAFRPDDTGPWAPRAATVWNPEDSTVTVTGITASGDWAFALTTSASAVAVDEAGVPRTFALHENYPNPFNPQTVIAYDLPGPAQVRLAVYDVLGREVALLIDRGQAAGHYRALFEADALPSGVYFYHLTAGPAAATRRMVLVK